MCKRRGARLMTPFIGIIAVDLSDQLCSPLARSDMPV